jgi:hypothetical protein
MTENAAGATSGVQGGDANERMDGGNDNVGRGADGDTEAREQLRVDLGERSTDNGREPGAPGLDEGSGELEV